jgi:RimJ/RimL family protein N-acetyltransferase
MTPEILTQRLRLTKLMASDAAAMFGYRRDPDVCRYQSFDPGSLAEVEDFIARLQSNAFDTPGTWFQFAIRLKETELLIGDLGTHFIADDPRQVEIGFTISPAYQGQGYGKEAVCGAISYLLGAIQKHRVFASVDPRNERSIALLERLGMRREAHFRESLWFKGAWVDDIVYGILESEWASD